MDIEKEPKLEYKHDIYLAGGWEKYCKTPYKSIIKESLPELDIYDPEDHQEGDWFEDDLEAIRDSQCIISYANKIPMSATTFELGYFYALQEEGGERIIILIWEEGVEPTNAVKWHERSGFVVGSVEEAIELYRGYLEGELK